MWPSTNVIFQVCGLIKCFIDQPWMIHLSIYVIVLMIISTRKTPYCLIVCIQTLPRATQGAANRGTNGNCFPNETFQEWFKIVKKIQHLLVGSVLICVQLTIAETFQLQGNWHWWILLGDPHFPVACTSFQSEPLLRLSVLSVPLVTVSSCKSGRT